MGGVTCEKTVTGDLSEMTKDNGTPGVIAPPPVLLLIALIAGFVLDRLVPLGGLALIPETVRCALGGLMLLLSLLLSLLGAGKFLRERTPMVPYRSPVKLVTTGIFAYTRNPMYLAFYAGMLGLALLFAADWVVLTAVVLALVIHYGVVRREERYLERRFGDEYRAYKERVPRYWRF